MFFYLDSFIAGGISLLGFTILTNPREVNVLGNRLLAILLILLAILVFDKGLIDNHFYDTHTELSGFTDVLLIFIPPTLYLSVVHFVSLDKTFDKKYLWHFLVPIFLVFVSVYQLIKYYLSDAKDLKSINYQNPYLVTFFIISIFIYWILSYLKIQKHQQNIEIFASATDKIDLDWLKYFLFGIAVMAVFFFMELYSNTLNVIQYASIGYLIATYILSYFALRQTEVFAFDAKEREEIKDIIEEQNPAKKQERLSEEVLMPLKIRLMELMQREKVYLDDTLNLPKLADKMDISTHDMSYLLNDGFGQSFFQFVNTYRIEEAKRLLLSEKHSHFNMLGIAYAAGFSSKTTFNTTFKKMTNQSPSEFQALAKNPA